MLIKKAGLDRQECWRLRLKTKLNLIDGCDMPANRHWNPAFFKMPNQLVDHDVPSFFFQFLNPIHDAPKRDQITSSLLAPRIPHSPNRHLRQFPRAVPVDLAAFVAAH